ncbi:hypothetical protein [Streptomyces sp. NPDC057460]|uniref:hypothetical protein n=1 Tax=Streptomyces sp. NPDC057460 TaxID=3346141 RepID=UPI003690C552
MISGKSQQTGGPLLFFPRRTACSFIPTINRRRLSGSSDFTDVGWYAATAASLSPDDYRRAFAEAMATLLAEFNAYLDRDGAEPAADAMDFRRPSASSKLASAAGGRGGQVLQGAEHSEEAIGVGEVVVGDADQDRQPFQVSAGSFPVISVSSASKGCKPK